MASPPPPAASWIEMLRGVLHESSRVAAAHSRHFLALSVLFLLPLSSLLVALPSLLSPFISPSPGPSIHPVPLLRLSFSPHLPSSASSPALCALAAAAAAASAALLFSLAAAASVSHSVHCGFFGRPVKLLPTLRSLPAAFARLLLTLLAAALPAAVLLTLLSSLLFASLSSLSFLHLPDTSLAAFLICSYFGAIAAISLTYLILNWSLAGAISILESSFGFPALWKSAALIHGMRWASLCLLLFFAGGIGLMLWGFSLSLPVGAPGHWGGVVPAVARTVFGCGVITVLLLYSLVTNAILYLYCKALHGELAGEIAEEFSAQYVCLPFDDHKVPHIVSVVQP